MTAVLDDQPVIETERLVLRPARPSDAGLLRVHAGDARVARMTRSIPHPLPPGATEAFLDRAGRPGRSEDIWIVDGLARGRPEVIGVLGLERQGDGRSEIGYWIAPAFWGAHIATEAVGGLVAANPQDAREITASVFQDNPASAKVLTHSGFAYVGEGRAFSVARDANVPAWSYVRACG